MEQGQGYKYAVDSYAYQISMQDKMCELIS